MGTDGTRQLFSIISIVALIAVSFGVMTILLDISSADDPVGSQDAWVVGKVTNGENGMLISCSTTDQSDPGDPKVLFFNGTTDDTGEFNITVDSNTWGDPQDYTPYYLTAFSTYYKEMVPGNDIYGFINFTYSGNVSRVPQGTLVAREYPTSNLTIKVLNRTSGEVLEGARVEIDYEQQEMPTPPFVTAKATDADGEALYPRVRSVNTSVEVTMANFRPLSETGDQNFVIVQEGGNSMKIFDLTEKPWPFSVLVNSIDVNNSEPITIDFKRVMDQSSITDASNYRFWKVDGDVDVPFTLTAKNGNAYVDLEPGENLEFNTTYSLRLDTPLKEDTGTKPLWRAMTVTFTTELPPGIVTGRVVDEKTLESVKNILVRIVDQISITGSDGIFYFPVIPKGTYKIDVDESYLYNSTFQTGLKVNKGETLDLGDVLIGPKQMGSLKVKVTSGGEPLEGAWVEVIDDLIMGSDLNLTTNSTGVAHFPRVLAGSVLLDVGAPHHKGRVDFASVSPGSEGYIEFDLTEYSLPVWIEPEDVNPDDTVLPGTDFMIHLPEAITFSTLNVTIWKTDEYGGSIEEIPLTPPEKGSDDLTYIVDPMISLPLESSFLLIISDEMMTLSSPHPILWRNLEYTFRTADLPLVHINGTLLFEGQVLEGYEVSFAGFTTTVDDTGNFNITVDPHQYDVVGDLIVNGSIYGYDSFEEELSLTAGTIYQVGIIDLYHVQGWYSVIPEDGSENIEPDITITAEFLESIMAPDQDEMIHLFSVIPLGSSAPINGDYIITNKTITFTPSEELEPNNVYQIKISKDLKRWDNVTMFPLGNITTFKVKPPAIRVTIIEPTETTSVPLDGTIRLGFTYDVVKQAVEQSVYFVPEVENVIFNWVSGSEMKITGYFEAGTDYTLTLPGGVYGTESEPLIAEFSLDFTTGDGYGNDHMLGTPQIFPSTEDGWELGETIMLSGVVEDSVGFQVTITFSKDGDQILERTVIVDSDGSWSINITTPSEEGRYTLRLTISMPGGPVADEVEYNVDVGDVETASPVDNTLVIIALAIIAIVVIAVIIGAVMYGRKQRAMADEELSKIEYTEIGENDWEDDEE